RQDVIVDLDQLARVDGGGAVRRNDDRDRLAPVANGVARQWGLEIARMLWPGPLAERDRRHGSEVGARGAGGHAGPRERPARIGRAQGRGGGRAAHDDRVHRAWTDHVVHKPSTADEQARILEPLDRNADEFHSGWPDYTIPPGGPS